MQTIKTAAIVVLMLTVMYGGYVSLTTPPDPLPDEIGEYLLIEEVGKDALGTAEQLAGGWEIGQPPAGILSADSSSSHEPHAGSHSSPDANFRPPEIAGNFDGSFADLPRKNAATSHALSMPAPGPTKLPEVGTTNAHVTPNSVDSYASTPTEFHLPDPATASSKFDPTKGTPFASPQTALNALGGPAKPNRGLINAFATADDLFAKGQPKEALATLSVFHGMPNLSPAQRGQLFNRLDPLAREVIYSRRHLLGPPHRVSTSETIDEIAGKYKVPRRLLANINQIDNLQPLVPGIELKIVPGPFRAEVDLTGKQLTLFLGDLYAGRFDIDVGNAPAPAAGTYTIQEKQTSHVFYDRSGVPVPPGSPGNPYGNMWLDLGGQICIHGSPNTVQPTNTGCISVAGDYADDVYGILSQGSSVTIRR